MKTRTSILFTLGALGSATLLFSSACSKADDSKLADAAHDTKVAVTNAVDDVKARSVEVWAQIKDFAYDKRSDFSKGVDSLAKKTDEKIASLKAEVAPGSADRTAAIKDYDEARAELKVKLAALDSATADTWADAKDQASKAWDKVEAAYNKAVK